MSTGRKNQVGYATETNWGTAVTPTVFLPISGDPKITRIPETIRAAGRIAGRRMPAGEQRAQGNQDIMLSIGHELLLADSANFFLRHLLGAAPSVSGDVSTFVPGGYANLAFTTQLGLTSVNDTVNPFTLAGCKIPKWELKLAVGENVTLGVDMSAKTITDATGLAVASYDAEQTPLTFVEGAVTIAGSGASVKDLTLTGDMKLSYGERRFVGSRNIGKEQVPLEHFDIRVKGTLEFESMTQYNRHLAGDEAAIVVTLDDGTNDLVITMNGRFDAGEPEAKGIDIVQLPFEAELVGDTDPDAITAVLTTP